ncbi:MAG: hypothetical protein J7L43_02765 [Candidatus Aenigmarchaeota archaeon]|nr:hypothetical protein [Candidatus Aenigmarchaeota archaeon]
MDDWLLRAEAFYAWMTICGRDHYDEPTFEDFLEKYSNDTKYRHEIATLALLSKDSEWKKRFIDVRRDREAELRRVYRK